MVQNLGQRLFPTDERCRLRDSSTFRRFGSGYDESRFGFGGRQRLPKRRIYPSSELSSTDLFVLVEDLAGFGMLTSGYVSANDRKSRSFIERVLLHCTESGSKRIFDPFTLLEGLGKIEPGFTDSLLVIPSRRQHPEFLIARQERSFQVFESGLENCDLPLGILAKRRATNRIGKDVEIRPNQPGGKLDPVTVALDGFAERIAEGIAQPSKLLSKSDASDIEIVLWPECLSEFIS
jgi:hypothetical protein